MTTLLLLFATLLTALRGRSALIAENLAMRQQLALLQRSPTRPRFRTADRAFWVLLSRLFVGWRSWITSCSQPPL